MTFMEKKSSMEKSDVKKLINDINSIYSGKFFKGKTNEDIKELLNMWSDLLKGYDYKEARDNLEVYAKNDNYNNPPQLYQLIKNLIPSEEKYSDDKGTYYCQFCERKFMSFDEMKIHEDRCRSTSYIIIQVRKWLNKNISKADLWQLSDDEFNARYNKMLHYIYDHTTDNHEKARIGFIFNPPSDYEAKKFLNNN